MVQTTPAIGLWVRELYFDILDEARTQGADPDWWNGDTIKAFEGKFPNLQAVGLRGIRRHFGPHKPRRAVPGHRDTQDIDLCPLFELLVSRKEAWLN